MTGTDDELVALTAVQGAEHARIITGILDGEGIESLVTDQMAGGALPFTVDGMGEVRIFVRRRDLVAARVILREYETEGE